MKTSTQIVVGIGVGIATTGAVAIGRECKYEQTLKSVHKQALISKEMENERLELRLEEAIRIQQQQAVIITNQTDDFDAMRQDLLTQLNLSIDSQTAVQEEHAKQVVSLKRSLTEYLLRQRILEDRAVSLQAETDEARLPAHILALLRDNAGIRICDLQQKVDELMAHRDALTVRVGEKDVELVESGAIHAATIQQLNAAHGECQGLQYERNMLADKVAQLEAQLVDAAHGTAIVTNERNELAIRVAQLETETVELNVANTQTQQQRDHFEGQWQALQLDLTHLQQARDGLQAQLVNLTHNNTIVTQERDALIGQRHTLHNDVNRLSQESDESARAIQGLREQLRNVSFAHAAVARERDTSYDLSRALQNQWDGLFQENGQLRVNLNHLQAQAAHLAADLHTSQHALEVAKRASHTTSATHRQCLIKLEEEVACLKKDAHLAREEEGTTVLVDGSASDRRNSTSTITTTQSTSADSSPPAHTHTLPHAHTHTLPHAYTYTSLPSHTTHSRTTCKAGTSSLVEETQEKTMYEGKEDVAQRAPSPPVFMKMPAAMKSDNEHMSDDHSSYVNRQYVAMRCDTPSPPINTWLSCAGARRYQDVRDEDGWIPHEKYDCNDICHDYTHTQTCKNEIGNKACKRFHCKDRDRPQVRAMLALQRKQQRSNLRPNNVR